jgi:hypothetical protein
VGVESSPWPRALGLVPAAFWVFALAVYAREARLDEMLWVCNVADLLLAVGLFAGWRGLVRTSTLWVVVGLPLWIWDVALTDFSLHGLFIHVLAGVVGIAALRGDRWPGRTWPGAAALGLAMQLAAHWLTAPALNVNVSHSPYLGVDGWLSSYPVYWALNIVAMTTALWIGERALRALTARLPRERASRRSITA